MSARGLIDGSLIGGRTIDNSQVVREVDPHHSRDLWGVLLVVFALVGGLGFYAWPHYAARQTAQATALLERERERLVEANRQLRLEKASLEDLRRVEKIAVQRLGLRPPAPERVVVVEPPAPAQEHRRLASRGEAAPPAP